MLSKRSLCLLTGVAVWRLCRPQCHTVPTDLNAQWRHADVLERYSRNYYNSLAVGPEDCEESSKRFVSIFSLATLLYLSNNVTDEGGSIRHAVDSTRRQLSKPGDVIAAPFRSVFTYIFSFVDQVLTDVQTACPYHVREQECDGAVRKLVNERTQLCPGYVYNVELYSAMVLVVTNCEFQNLYDDLSRASATGRDVDAAALDFFVEAASIKFTNILKFFKFLLKGVTNTTFTCNSVHFI